MPGDEGPILHRLRQLAPVLGIGLLVLGLAGWPLGFQLESDSALATDRPSEGYGDTRASEATDGSRASRAERSLAAEDALLTLLEGEAVDDDRPEPVEELLGAGAVATSESTATVAQYPRFDLRVGDPRDRAVDPTPTASHTPTPKPTPRPIRQPR